MSHSRVCALFFAAWRSSARFVWDVFNNLMATVTDRGSDLVSCKVVT